MKKEIKALFIILLLNIPGTSLAKPTLTQKIFTGYELAQDWDLVSAEKLSQSLLNEHPDSGDAHFLSARIEFHFSIFNTKILVFDCFETILNFLNFQFFVFSCVPINIKQQKLQSADLEPNFIQVEAKWSPFSAKLGHVRGYFGLLRPSWGMLRTPIPLQKRRKSMLSSLCASFASVKASLSLEKLPMRLQNLHFKAFLGLLQSIGCLNSL